MNPRAQPITVEVEFNKTAEDVWSAITNLDEMQIWYFEQLTAFEPTVGFETSFLIKVEDRSYTHLWKITEVVPNEKISYEWRYKEVEGVGNVTFELSEENNKVKLILTNTGLDSFPDDIPEFTLESCQKGWNYLLKESLVAFLTE